MGRLSMILQALVCVITCAGCAEKAVEMRLELPAGTAADFDVSCINQVTVTTYAADFVTKNQCVEISGATSLADVQRKIRGRFELDMPDQLLAIQIHASATETPNACPSGDMIFYGGAEYAGGDQLTLPVEGTLDCSVHQASSARTVKLVDFAKLIAGDPAVAATCVAPATPVAVIESGTLHATNLSPPDFTPTATTTWETASVVDGKATIPIWNSTLGASCPALVNYDNAGNIDSAACVLPSAPTICAGANETEVPIFPYATAVSSWDDAIVADHKGAVLVSVWDAATKKPITGATITISTGAGQVVYGDWNVAQAKFIPGGSATAARGLAMVYSNEPAVVTIAAPGHRSIGRVIGAPWDAGSAAIVVLDAAH